MQPHTTEDTVTSLYLLVIMSTSTLIRQDNNCQIETRAPHPCIVCVGVHELCRGVASSTVKE